ncbi:MAG TPA: YheC/YheD family protein [Gammaproteobacteria bacterium]|nr:YheC/YheD family protein [Gammaproteobacteria bacterium]
MQYHFYSYKPAIRFHLSNRLDALGWIRAPECADADFSDKNLTLNDHISKHLEYKHLLWALLGTQFPNMMPTSYYINDENYPRVIREVFKAYYKKHKDYGQIEEDILWILKPSMLNNGDQIILFNNLRAILNHYLSGSRLGGDHVLQRYIHQPDLIEGHKYTFRIPVVVTNYAGVFVYHNGYINISSVPYHSRVPLSFRKMHLTNYILDGELANIRQELASFVPQFITLYAQMCDVVKNTVLAICRKFPEYLRLGKEQKFEIFGFDFIVDNKQKLWLLEINQGPDFPMIPDHKLNKSLWFPFWEDILHHFVLPIAEKKAPLINYLNFNNVLKPGKIPTRWVHKFWY